MRPTIGLDRRPGIELVRLAPKEHQCDAPHVPLLPKGFNVIDLGQIAYEGYCESSGNRSLISGAELPKWDDLKPEIREAWNAAARAVIAAAG